MIDERDNENNSYSNNNDNNNNNNYGSGYSGYSSNESNRNVPPGYGGASVFGSGVTVSSPFQQKKRMSGWKKGLIIFLIILVVVVAFAVITFVGSPGKGNYSFTSPAEPYLAKISVIGEIGDFNDSYASSDSSYHHDWTIGRIDDLISDEDNKGIILYVDSPGGSVYESDELYLKLKQYQEKTERPIYVYMGSMAASGGYYISAEADKIYANRNTWTGSIGVIVGTLFDVSEFLEKYGIKATDITSGPNKGMGGYFEPMTDEQRAIMQSLVDEAYEQFVGIVADGRDLDIQTAKRIADGRIYSAKQALGNGLIDEIASESEAYEQMKADAGDPNMLIQSEYYEASTNLFGNLLFKAFDVPAEFNSGNTGTNVTQGDIAKVLEMANEGSRMPIKYLYGG